MGFSTQDLDGIHQFFVLREKRLAQGNGPLEVLVHFLNDLGHARRGFDVFVPGLLIEFGEVVCIFHESRGLDNFEGIHGSREDGGDQWIRIKRDRRDQILEVGRSPFWRCRGRWGSGLRLRLG